MTMVTSKTQLRQSAVKAAAEIAAAGLSAGLFGKTKDAVEAARTAFKQDRESIFVDLVKVFEAEEAAALADTPANTARVADTGRRSPNQGGPISADDAAGFVLTWGAFKGLSLGQIAAVPAGPGSGETGDYGYPKDDPGSKSGMQYLEWLAQSKEPKAKYARDRAEAFIQGRREAAA